ncbi:MAG: hypothetical protein CML24_10750 [Rhizobiales bacterium]|nr:hypothetical protein [Hyphomicrobiales bacterium]|tara:strand:+ start:6612 stop:7085 length:474 start_codon:yes stop_codon:yes gene_type:complete
MSTATNTSVPDAVVSQRAAQRRATAARTRKWRRSRAAAGVPEARDVDRAISEAVSFQLQRVVLSTLNADGPTLAVADIFRIAVIALVRDGANREEAKKAVRSRFEPRPEHKHPGYAPSITPTRTGVLMKPKRDDAFHPADVAYLHELAGIRRDDMNP